jgi:hypothetical protein
MFLNPIYTYTHVSVNVTLCLYMTCNYLHLHNFTLFYTCSFIITFTILIKRAIDKEPLDQMIKLVINKQIGKKKFHGCQLVIECAKNQTTEII